MSAIKLFRLRVNESYAAEDEAFLNAFLEAVVVQSVNSALVSGSTEAYWSVIVHFSEADEERTEVGGKFLYDAAEPLMPEEEERYFRLRAWREQEALRRGLPGFLLVHTAHLKTFAKLRPKTLADLEKVQGLSRKRIDKYGELWLRLLWPEATKPERN